MLRHALKSLVPLALVGSLCALGGSRPATSPRMLTALETVRPENIRADVTFVASDEMRGRDTPSEEQRITARFLRARLERLGWAPGARDGYLFRYPLEQKLLDESKCSALFKAEGRSLALTYGRDYFLGSTNDARTSRVSGKLVFAGQGSRSDFDNKALAGAWALCFDDGDTLKEVVWRATRAKCAGVLLAPGPDYKGEPYEVRYQAKLESLRRGTVSYPRARKPGKDEGEERADDSAFVPGIALSRDAVERLLALSHEAATPRAGTVIGDFTEERALSGDGTVWAEDVAGLWPGSDPDLGKETILLSAHYDHVGVGRDGAIYNGADDNGSGTTGMLAIAEALTQHGPLRRSVMIVWVSGEEKGLWGSQAWTADPYIPGDRRPICDINIDMIGRNEPTKLLVTPTSGRRKDYNGLVQLAEALAPEEGFPELGSADEYYTRSDHANFAKLGIPVMFLFSDVHEDYHKPTDDVEKLDFDKIRRVSRLVLRVLDGLQTDKLDIGPVH